MSETRFKNPANKHVETVTTSFTWLWALLWAPLYFAVKGMWGWAIISFAFAVVTLTMSNIVFAFAVYPIVKKKYNHAGWVEVAGTA